MKNDYREVKMNPSNNLLELEEPIYNLTDVETPNVFRNLYPYDEIPKIAFNDRIVPHNMPDRKSTRLNSSHPTTSRMPSSA